MIAIDRLAERNLVGLCHLDVVDVEDVLAVPDELDGRVGDEVELKEGKTWSRIYLEDDGGLFQERWVVEGGAQHSEAVISGDVAKDRLALMPHLWRMHGRRYLVIFRTQNGDQLLMGRPETGAMAQVRSRTTGSAEAMARDRNGYSITFRLARRMAVPFYLGDPPPDPTTTVCAPGSLTVNSAAAGTIASGATRNLPVVNADTLEPVGTYNASEGRHEVDMGEACPTPCEVIDELINAGGTPNGNALVSGVGDGGSGEYEPYDTVDGKTAYQLGPWVLQYSNTLGNWYFDGPEFIEATQEGGDEPWNVTWPNGITVEEAGGSASAAAVLDCIPEERWDELRGVLCDAPEPASVRSAASDPLYATTVAAGGTLNLPQVRVVRGDGTNLDVEYRPAATSAVFTEVHTLYADFRAGDALSAAFTVPAVLAGTYTVFTNDGGSGTITWQTWNGSTWVTLLSLALSAGTVVRAQRTITTNAGWAQAATG